jgi:hypothetical protein
MHPDTTGCIVHYGVHADAAHLARGRTLAP